jgi:hypothetical protein
VTKFALRLTLGTESYSIIAPTIDSLYKLSKNQEDTVARMLCVAGLSPMSRCCGSTAGYLAGFGLFILLSLANLISPAVAQTCSGTCTEGHRAIYESSTSTGADGQTLAAVHAEVFSGSDPCAQINNAAAALPSTGGTVDARHFSGTISCMERY